MPSITKDAYLWSFFFAGMVCRELKERVYITESNAEWFLLASIILIIVVDPTLFRVPGTIFLAFIFFSILSGGSLFGLLKTRAAIRLGTISYSLYITQGLILFPAYNLYIKEFTLNLDSSYFIFLCMSYAAICFLSATTYHFIELPFMKIGGRKSTKKLNQANVLDK